MFLHVWRSLFHIHSLDGSAIALIPWGRYCVSLTLTNLLLLLLLFYLFIYLFIIIIIIMRILSSLLFIICPVGYESISVSAACTRLVGVVAITLFATVIK